MVRTHYRQHICLFKILLSSILFLAGIWRWYFLYRAATKIPNQSSFLSPSHTFLFETAFLKSLVLSTAITSMYTTHTQLALFHNNCDPSWQQAEKYHRVFKEIPGGSSNFTTDYFHFATGKTVETEDQIGQDEKTHEYSDLVLAISSPTFIPGPKSICL